MNYTNEFQFFVIYFNFLYIYKKCITFAVLF